MGAIFSAIGSVLPLFLLIGVGYFVYDRKWVGPEFSEDISKIILKISLPAATFVSVLKYLDLSAVDEIRRGAGYFLVSLILGYGVAVAIAYGMKIGKSKRALFVNSIVNTNMVFIGMPLQIAVLGEESFRHYLIIYVLGTFSIWCVGAIYIFMDAPKSYEDINLKEGGRVSGFSWRRLLPAPMVGFFAGVVVLAIGIKLPDFIGTTLDYLAAMVSPLSLIYIGLMLRKVGIKHLRIGWDVFMVILGRFLILPAITVLLLLIGPSLIGDLDPMMKDTLVLQAFAPTLSVLPILANESGTDVKYATTVITSTTFLFALIIPVVVFFIR
ncbi:AEC family transporter [Anaerovoracaceae bacterium SGI.195]